MIDLSKIKPGDEVLVRGVVRRTRDEPGWPALEVELNLEGGICYPNGEDVQEISMGLSAIVEHHPKALSVGDRVIKAAGVTFTGVIVAIDANRAWVTWGKRDGGWGEGDEVLPLADLERA